MKRVILALSVLIMSIVTSQAFAATEQTIAKGGFSSVIVYTPTKVSPIGNGRSLLVVLHGCTQAISAFKTAKLGDAADAHGMVVAVPDAKHKEGFSCWGYWSGTPSRTYNDYKNLINLVNEMLKDSTYNIDPDQVYIAGLSSGGAFAMETGCLAPDIFAGMGLVGAPSAGTGMNGAFGHEGTVASTKTSCLTTAGTNKSHFDTQVTVSAFGSSDSTVPKTYGPQNAKAMAAVYGHSEPSIASTKQPNAKILINTEKTVALVELTGEGHTWPGGKGASGSYIGNATINYASYLGEFFAENNRRVSGGGGNIKPEVSASVSVSGVSAIVTGTATDSDGTVVSVKASIKGVSREYAAGPFTLNLNSSGQFTHSFDELRNGNYEITVEATDDKGAVTSKSVNAQITAGPNTSCPSVTGTVEQLLVSHPALVESNQAGWPFYRTTGDKETIYKSGGASYTIFIGADGKGYIEDPDNCVEVIVPVEFTVTATAGAGGNITPPSQTIAQGNKATFVVTANSGYQVNSVTGCGGSLAGSVYTTGVITANCTVSATFKQQAVNPVYHTVTASAGNGGTINPASQSVESGKTANFTVSANSGYVVNGVSGCGGVLIGNTYTTGAITANCAVNATFRQEAVAPVYYTVTASAGNGGTVSPTTQQVVSGARASITVTAASGYKIASVTGCSGTLQGNTYTTGTVTKNCSINASFTTTAIIDEPTYYTVKTNAGANGFISPAKAKVVEANSSLIYTITPDNGYVIAAISGCGGVWNKNADVGNYLIAAVTGDCTVYATFKKAANDDNNNGGNDDNNGGDDNNNSNNPIGSIDGGAMPPVLLLIAVLPFILRRRNNA